MKKTNKRFGAFLLVVLMLVAVMAGCAEIEKGEIQWKPTGGDPNVEAGPTAAPEKIVTYGAYPNTVADADIVKVLKNQVVVDSDTGVWAEYEQESTDDQGVVTVISARYDLQTGLYYYQEKVDGQVKVDRQFVNENGKFYTLEPISWIVLEEKADAYVLISRDLLDAGFPFHDVLGATTWADSSVRDWLNGTDAYAAGGSAYAETWNFLNRAFTDAEIAQMKKVTLNTKDNEAYHTLGGGETEDLVYLLTGDDLATYFGKDLTAQSTGTPYAKERGLKVDKKDLGAWWLRSPAYEAAFQGVDRNGDMAGFDAAATDLGIRPVICVNKSAF